MIPRRSEFEKLFGGIYQHDEWAAPSWQDEGKWMVLCVIPDGFQHIINTATGKQLKHVYMNKLMREAFLKALQEVKDKGLATKMQTFDGCYQIRKVRGSEDKISTHSYGLAFDINAYENQLGQPGNIDKSLIKIFNKHGFVWGGTFKRLDPMHFQFCTEN